MNEVIVVGRHCMFCAHDEEAVGRHGKPGKVYYLRDRLPLSNRCQHCGLQGLLPDEPLRIRPRPAMEPIDYRGKPGPRGRPPISSGHRTP